MGQRRTVPSARQQCKPCSACRRAGDTRSAANGCSGMSWSRGPHLSRAGGQPRLSGKSVRLQ
eukprot:6578062-Pyramimonas_sp.AAC.1